jgi:glyoxylase-like metal-dependent hydrolase (beta-lactamase superfamily II)
MTTWTARRWVVGTVALMLSAASYGSLVAQSDPRPVKPAYDDGNVEVVPVRGSVYLVAGSGANISVQLDSDGLLLVDTSVAAMSEKVLAAIRTISGKPIRQIINTSADAHHTGGNETLSTAGRPRAGTSRGGAGHRARRGAPPHERAEGRTAAPAVRRLAA